MRNIFLLCFRVVKRLIFKYIYTSFMLLLATEKYFSYNCT